MPSFPRSTVHETGFNRQAELPYSLRSLDFQAAMQDVYDLFHDVNSLLVARGLRRLEDMLRPAAMSGVVSDLLAASLANHARTLNSKQTLQRPSRLAGRGHVSEQRRQCGNGRRGDQIDSQERWRS